MASGPLGGIRVLEFTQIIAGPLGCQFLADLGAEVIKIEPPNGEPWRLAAQFIPLESKTFIGLNRGKKSLAINLANEKSREAIHRLVNEIDVVVINYRPDVAKRLGIDYETLSKIKPDIIYLDNTAWGREGHLADRPGYDIVVQAFSGMMSSVGKVTDAGAPQVGPAYADTTTGYAICSGVLAALFHRERTGEGQKVETSLLINALTTHMSAFHSVPVADQIQRDSFLQMLTESRETGASYANVLRKRDELLKTAAQGNVYYRVFETADGAIAIGALSASLREKIRTTVGFEHNRDEPGYDPLNPAQLAIDASVIKHVEGIFSTHNTDEWEQILTAGGVPCAPVKFVQELLEDEHVISNNYVIELEHELAGPIKMQAPPWKMSKTPPTAQGASPTLGKHTDELLAEVGYSESEIADLRQNGAIL